VRLQLVVNPSAGGGRATKVLPSVQAALAEHDLVVSPTRSLEHADELVAAAVADDRVVVAMGGDGIVGRVAGTVSRLGGVMGVVPGGRGNDFCRSVGIPRDPVAAATALGSYVETSIDLGDADGQAFIGIASIGFDSDCQERALRSTLPLGQLTYLVSALATVASWKPAAFRCAVDGEPLVLEGWSVAVANTGMYGGGMRLAPDASVTDGRLDVVTTRTTSRLTFLRSLPKVFKGTHVDEPSVSVRQGTSVTLDADRPFRVFADGDPVAALPCTISVRPAALRVLLPA
jgi:YegS/Rv2252/BmrU family lipid kinase